MHRNSLLSLVAGAAVWLIAQHAEAQYPGAQAPMDAGISVNGTGEIRIPPDVVEINMRVAAKAELTDDAVVKHRDARKRTMEAFQALKLENLKLVERDLGLRPANSQEMMQAMMNGMGTGASKRPQIEVSSMLRARLKVSGKLEEEEMMSTIGKLLDAAQDSGSTVGPTEADMSMAWRYGRMTQAAIVKFIVTNAGEMREKASQLAVDDARRKAQRLARLNGVTLGAVVAVQEFDTVRGTVYNPWMGEVPVDDPDTPEELTADSMTGAVIKVKLHVRFAIAAEKPAAEKAAAEKGEKRTEQKK